MSTLLAVSQYGCGFSFSGACGVVMPTRMGSEHGATEFYRPQPITNAKITKYHNFLNTITGNGSAVAAVNAQSRVGNVVCEVSMNRADPRVLVSDGVHTLQQRTAIRREDPTQSQRQRLEVHYNSIQLESRIKDLPAIQGLQCLSIDHPLVDLLLEAALAIFKPKDDQGELLNKEQLWTIMGRYYAEEIVLGRADEAKPGFGFPSAIKMNDRILGNYANIQKSPYVHHTISVCLNRGSFSAWAAYPSDWENGLHEWMQTQITKSLGHIIVAPQDQSTWPTDLHFFPYTVEGDTLTQVR